MIKNIIVAVSDNWAIGKGNKMPWHINGDLKHFKELTSAHPVIMGSKTYESIGQPLTERVNIVVTHKYIYDGVIIANSINDAYKIAEKFDNQCFIIGGASLYDVCINDADYIYLTHIYTTIDDADTFFPKLDVSVWELVSSSDFEVDEKSGIVYNFETYKRK